MAYPNNKLPDDYGVEPEIHVYDVHGWRPNDVVRNDDRIYDH